MPHGAGRAMQRMHARRAGGHRCVDHAPDAQCLGDEVAHDARAARDLPRQFLIDPPRCRHFIGRGEPRENWALAGAQKQPGAGILHDRLRPPTVRHRTPRRHQPHADGLVDPRIRQNTANGARCGGGVQQAFRHVPPVAQTMSGEYGPVSGKPRGFQWRENGSSGEVQTHSEQCTGGTTPPKAPGPMGAVFQPSAFNLSPPLGRLAKERSCPVLRLRRHEFQRHRVDAIPLPRRRLRCIVKNMPQVPATMGAEHLRPGHAH